MFSFVPPPSGSREHSSTTTIVAAAATAAGSNGRRPSRSPLLAATVRPNYRSYGLPIQPKRTEMAFVGSRMTSTATPMSPRRTTGSVPTPHASRLHRDSDAEADDEAEPDDLSVWQDPEGRGSWEDNVVLRRLGLRKVESDRPSDMKEQTRRRSSGRTSLQRSLSRLSRRLQWQGHSVMQPISPQSMLTRLREIVLFGLLLFLLFYLPFEASFVLRDQHKEVNYEYVKAINIAVELLLLAQVILNFNTARYVEVLGSMRLAHKRRDIACAYLKGDFLLDMLGSLPVICTVFLVSPGSNDRLWNESDAPVHVLVYVLRLLWLRHLPRLLFSDGISEVKCAIASKSQAWCGEQHNLLCVMSKLVFGILFIIHYLTCAWNYLEVVRHDEAARGHSTSRHSSNSLMVTYCSDALHIACGLMGSPGVINRISEHVTADTNGSATDILAGRAMADTFGVVLAIAGVMMTSYVIASVTAVVIDLRESTYTHFELQKRSLTRQMQKLELPTQLQDRIQRYHEHLLSEYDALNSDIIAFVRGLSRPLAFEVLLSRYADLVTRRSFWSGSSPELTRAIILRLEIRVYMRNDYIVSKGEVGHELFLLHRGEASLTGLGQEPRQLTHGATFGELALLADYNRTTSVCTDTHVEMCVLNRRAFHEVTAYYQHERRSIVVRLLQATLKSGEYPSLYVKAQKIAERKRQGNARRMRLVRSRLRPVQLPIPVRQPD